jgi:RNA polymerase sigma-70 factor (ECF subfamily)
LVTEDSYFPDPSLTDAHLVRQTLAGCNPAFDELILRYQRQAIAVAYRLLGNLHDALDVTQDAFAKAYSSLPMLTRAESFGGWLMRIVSNLSLNFRRSRSTRSALPLDDLLPSSQPDCDPLHRMESAELGQAIHRALDGLPTKQRSALCLFSLNDLPQKQVAQMLDTSVEAVKWHVFQGRRNLRESLAEHF